MLDPKSKALSILFGKTNARRLTFGQMREATRIKRGLGGVLEALRAEGKVYYELGASGQWTDDTIIALCGTIWLKYNYKLTVLAPDEAAPTEDGQSVWQVLIHGTPDPVLASEGHHFYPTNSLWAIAHQLRDFLYNSVSSSVVDETWSRVEGELKIFYDRYALRRG
ncbi:MAG TPA: hypothetical protein VJC15_01635 [Candidatus Paceibacterota bacterium]